MFHEFKGEGQLGQWLRVCGRCEYIFIGKNRSCPKCEFAHYSAPFVYCGWVPAIWRWIKQMMKGSRNDGKR